MGRPLKWSVEQKLSPVLSVLRGEGSVAEIGRYHQVSDVTLAKWRDAFLTGGAAALANSGLRGQPIRTTFGTSAMKQCRRRLGRWWHNE